MPKSVVAVAATDTRNAPVIANVGGQRAASHSSRGNANASGSNEIQDCVVWEKTKVEIKAKRVSTTAPSIVSRREGSFRKARENSIMSGAMSTIPMPSERNHTPQSPQKGALV